MAGGPSYLEYHAQAVRFAVLAQLATKHSNDEKKKFLPTSMEWRSLETFEAVSIAIAHGFAIEMLIKGIRAKKNLTPCKKHNLAELLKMDDFQDVYNQVEEEYSKSYHGFGSDRPFCESLNDAANLFVQYRYHFEINCRPVNADFTSFLYGSLLKKLE